MSGIRDAPSDLYLMPLLSDGEDEADGEDAAEGEDAADAPGKGPNKGAPGVDEVEEGATNAPEE